MFGDLCLNVVVRLLLTLTLSNASEVALPTEPAYIQNNYKQLVTSSTLQWIHVSSLQSGQVSSNAVVTVESSAVCRVRDGVEMLPGRTDLQGKCVVGAGGMVTLRSSYWLLVDLWGMSRLEWKHWDMFSLLLPGTVAYTDQVYVARVLRTDQPFMLGDLNTQRGLSGDIRTQIPDNHTELHTNFGYHTEFTASGDVLVEVEPVKYKLTNIQFVTRREKTKFKAFHVGSLTVTRDGDKACVTETLRYNYTASFHWGRIQGTIRGLSAVAVISQDHTQFFMFGMESSQLAGGEWSVSAALLPGTATNVTVRASLVSTEVPYTAVLESIYSNGVPSKKHVSGIYSYTRLDHFSEDHGEAFDYGTEQKAESPCAGHKRTDCCQAYTVPVQPTTSTTTSTSTLITKTTTITTTTTTLPETQDPLSTLFLPTSSTVSSIDENRQKWMKMFYSESLVEEDESKNEIVRDTRRAEPLSERNSANKRLQTTFLTVIIVVIAIK